MDRHLLLSKCLAVGIILLFVGVTMAPAIAQNTEKSQSTSRGNWLYVGGSGPGNYTSINDAIHDAIDGDTIFVFHDSSPYYEHVNINKKISLIGENKETTIIDGQNTSDVVHISSDNVNLSGFTITKSGDLPFPNYDDAGVEIAANFCNVSENLIISNGDYGVLIGSYIVDGWHDNQISNNVINYNYYGVYIFLSNANIIQNNTICFNRYDGVYLLGSPCSSNRIIDNNISFNKINGIEVEDGSNNIIQGNIVNSNNDSGININWYTNGNKIINNHIKWNHLSGIFLFNSQHTTVTGNTIEGNQLNGLELDDTAYTNIFNNSFIYNGLFLNSYNGNTISGNTVNGKPLIYLYKQQGQVIENAGQVIVNGCDGITIKNCNISYTDWGILLSNSDDCSILNNTIHHNTKYGMYLSNVSTTIIEDNDIYENGPGVSGGCTVFIEGGSSNKFIRNRFVDNVPKGMILDSSNNVLQRNSFSNDGLCLLDAYDNWIIFNNFFNDTSVISIFYNPQGFESIANHWLNNYWGKPHYLPKLIFGKKYVDILEILGIVISIPIPVVSIDVRPALFPH
jgi:parallel beta-helix repeat protein